MAEYNRHTLEEALRGLPQYDPPAEVWNRIRQQADRQREEQSLHDAIEKLPQYDPLSEVWGQIGQALQNEQAEQKPADCALKHSLRELPAYEPPSAVWEGIEEALSTSENEAPLQQGLKQLPTYQPPAAVWESIEREWQPEEENRVVPLRTWLLRAAAAIVLALGTWYFWPGDYIGGSTATYAHQTEEAALEWTAALTEQPNDEAAIQQAVELFREDPLARSSAQYDALIDEWEELKAAKAEIAEIIELYGKDARLIRQISEIEQERSELLRQMVNTI